jgi:hypothetical protein
VSTALAYIGAVLVAAWGLAHVIPTRRVVLSFGPISADNSRIITQEWLAEGIMMWGIAAFVIVSTATAQAGDVRVLVYRVAAGLLVTVGVLTALTGARTRVVWFRVCPVVMAAAAALLLAASAL